MTMRPLLIIDINLCHNLKYTPVVEDLLVRMTATKITPMITARSKPRSMDTIAQPGVHVSQMLASILGELFE